MNRSFFKDNSLIKYLSDLKFWARLFLGGVLIFASLSKLFYPSSFLEFTEALLGVGPGSADILFVVTVAIEMATGLAIFLWRYSSVPAAFAGFLFLIFSGIVLYAMMIDLSASCGCFGAFLENQEATPTALARNLIFACISFLLVFRN